MLTNLLWLLAGLVIAGWWFRHSGPMRDYYAVETVGIMDDAGGKLTDIDLISGGGVWRIMYDVTPDGPWSYVIRRKGQRQVFASKGFAVFEDHAAARENFDKMNGLFLSVPAQGWIAHRIFLWAVAARNRGAVPGLLLKGSGNPRKLAETDYRALLAMYHKPLVKIVADE
jgi:hypothetical protein